MKLRNPILHLCLGLMVAVCLIVTPAAAQSGAAGAQKHLVEGERFAQQGKWQEALDAFDKAHAAQPSAATATRRANALYQLGKLIDAYDAYQDALTSYGRLMFGKDKKAAESRIEELEGKIGTLTVVVSETGATVRVDDQPAGTSPVPGKMRVLAGEHSVRVTKSGFVAFQKTVQVAAKKDTTVDARLDAVSTMGRLEVSVSGAEGLVVLVDGKEVGPAPYQGEIEPGPHEIAARGDGLEAPAKEVEIKPGETSTVALEARELSGRLEVRIKGDEGTIFIDGKEVAKGRYQGDVPVGKHQLKVERKGFDTFEKTIDVSAEGTQLETVSLHKAAKGDEVSEEEGDWTFDGLYGGLQLTGLFQPLNSGNTLDAACDTTGATSCSGGTVAGGGLGGYIGYAFAPVGLELLVMGSGDVVQPTASFDGKKGSDINPLVAQPAREEQFIIGRFGGGGAIRGRLLWPVSIFRITVAAGVGLAYKYLVLGRDGTAPGGYTSSMSSDGKTYLSPALSFELAGQVRMAGTSSFTLGLNLWLEHAGNDVRSDPEPNVILTADGAPPQPHATPGYDMATGTQLYLGPFLGFHFGP